MQQTVSTRQPIHPIICLLLLIAFFFLGQMIGGVIGAIFAVPFLKGDIAEIAIQLKQIFFAYNYSITNAWIVLMIVQAFSSAGGFILASWAYLRFIEGRKLSSLNTSSSIQFLPLVIIVLVGFSFIIFNEWVLQWNRTWKLPDWLSGLDQREKLNGMVEFLTSFDSVGELIIALIVIAVLPAIGEELMFRGVMQSILVRWTLNIHVSIWLTAAFFSFIHFQLDGFVPRMLLGAVFGYLYAWSGNLWYAIWAHFINNGVTVLGVYLNKAQKTEIDLEHTEWITWSQALIAAAVTAALLWYVKRLFDQSKRAEWQMQ